MKRVFKHAGGKVKTVIHDFNKRYDKLRNTLIIGDKA